MVGFVVVVMAIIGFVVVVIVMVVIGELSEGPFVTIHS